MTAALMLNGTQIAQGSPALVLDDGLVRGDGVFEGLRSYGRRLRTLDAHLDRFARSAAEIRLDFDRAQLRRELEAFVQITTSDDCAVRLIVTRQGQRIIREEPLFDLSEPWVLAPVPHRITPLLVASKTLSYAANMQAQRLAAEAGANSALLYGADDNLLLEGPVFSIAWLAGDDLFLPPLSLGILDSITRRLLIEAVPGVKVKEIAYQDLAEADGLLCLSTVLESQPVSRLVGVGDYPTSGSRINGIREALAEITRERLG